MRQRSLLSRRGLTAGRRGFPLNVQVLEIGHMQWVSAAPPTPPGRSGEAWYIHDKIFYRARMRPSGRRQLTGRVMQIATGPPGDPWKNFFESEEIS